MKTKHIILIVLIVLLVGAGWWFSKHNAKPMHAGHADHKDFYYCPMHPQVTSDRPGDCPICFMKLVKKQASPKTDPVASKKISYWTDPMILGFKADKPGKSPMGMDLIPVYEQETMPSSQTSPAIQGYSAVMLNDTQQQLIGVKTIEVANRPLIKTIHSSGTVAHGIDLYKVQSEFIDAYVQFITTYRDYKRFSNTRRTWEIHREVQLKMLEAEHNLLMLGLDQHQIDLLRQINRQQIWNQPELMFFKSDKKYWIYVQLFEDDRGYVDPNQEVEIELLSYREKFKGIVRSVGGAVDPESRTIRVLIEPQKDQVDLTIGMLANVSIKAELGRQLAVPKEAVMDTGERKIVFVAKSDGVFEPREVEIGARADGYWAVTKGLTAGEHVVVDGNFLLDSESRLQASFKNSAQQSQQEGESHVD